MGADTSCLFHCIPWLQSHPRATELPAPALRMPKIPAPRNRHGAWDPRIVLLQGTTFPVPRKSVPAFQVTQKQAG